MIQRPLQGFGKGRVNSKEEEEEEEKWSGHEGIDTALGHIIPVKHSLLTLKQFVN